VAREATRESRGDERERPDAASAVNIADPAVRLLCRLALTDAESLAWLRSHDDTAWFDTVDVSGILSRLLSGTRPADTDPASLLNSATAFNASEQAFLSSLLNSDAPPLGLDDARAAYHHLKIQRLRGLIDQKQAQLKSPGLAPQEILTLTTEVVALQREWREMKSVTLAASPLAPF
jgi:hypothetical protein